MAGGDLAGRRAWPPCPLCWRRSPRPPRPLRRPPPTTGRRRPRQRAHRGRGGAVGPRQAPPGARHAEEPVRRRQDGRRARTSPRAPTAPTRPTIRKPELRLDPDLDRRRAGPRRRAPAPRRTPTPTPGTPASPPKTYAPGSTSRSASATATGSSRKTLKRLQPLPTDRVARADLPGPLADGKTAIFLVDEGVDAVGDGDCDPAPDKCETLSCKAGETEFLDVKDDTGNEARSTSSTWSRSTRRPRPPRGRTGPRRPASRPPGSCRACRTGGSVRGATGLRAVTGL